MIAWQTMQSLSLPWQPAGQHMSPLTHCWIWLCALPQTPLVHVVPPVQALASSQAMPLFAGTPFTHLPALHFSPIVQRLLSLHAAPSLPGTATQLFMASLHVPIMHTSPGAAQVLGMPAQVPAWQVSLTVQKRLSSQAAPSARGITLQPSCGSQKPFEQVPSRKVQSMGPPGLHMPPEQVPGRVHASSSLHEAPSLPGTWMHWSVAMSQRPSEQVPSDGQNLSEPPVHTPIWQVSFSVQPIPSLQAPNSFAGSLLHSPLMQAPVLH
jgi:hypothetical protein